MPFAFEPIGAAETTHPILSPDNRVITTERRVPPSVGGTAALQLLRPGCADGIACKATNVSEIGMHVAAAVSAGLTLGQRFEVVPGHDCKNGAVASALGAGCYATVVRMAKAVDEDSVQATLRFDHPLPL